MDQSGKVANPARGQLNRENKYFSCPRSRLKIWSREMGSDVPSRVSLLILYTQAESGALQSIGYFSCKLSFKTGG